MSRARQELQILESMVRRILKKNLQLYPYRLKLILKLKPNNPAKGLALCEEVLDVMAKDELLSKRIIFSDKVTFHLSG
jgi:hypothetical protein